MICNSNINFRFFDFCNMTKAIITYKCLWVFTKYFLVEDMERNNGEDKPYFVDQDLLDLINLKEEEDEIALIEEVSHVQ